MKKFLAAMILMMFASTANAAWCEARSPSAYGWGTAMSIQVACQRALQECAMRTPWGQTCYVVSSGY